MLDSDTKQKIDSLRNILVGKIPNPQSQVEQITTGLIYKFMHDMDQESIEMGGEGSFFVGDYEKYSWNNLFDTKLSGVDKVKLYSDAIEGMYLNPNAPELFRNIFKNAFLPFKDPSTLNMFLKEINEFHYSHSEKLGDAFEYLISIMGSQGDAGQFRTPRHIIDFIVEIINPQKHETVLDPACGTGGFLISSYKHILKTNTDKKLGDQLSAEDKKRVGENVTGYDISPEMIRLSLVNMYLHGFSTPKIDEYDTLSSDDKWNEYYDVILANPPFFSPKGGIQPHKRFGVESKKAEVLFTSYILEHLKPNGRAGIIVPEGIIFQTGKAYKKLRKQLVENALIAVISFPAGVFQPYSGVKTSVLILDKKLNKERDSIFFAEVKNDGFSLGTQRTSIDKNDLPGVLKKFKNFNASNFDKDITKIEKDEIASNNFSLNFSSYNKEEQFLNSNFPLVKLGSVIEISRGGSPRPIKDYITTNDNGINWIKIGDAEKGSKYITKTKQKIKPEGASKSRHVLPGDFILSNSMSFGRPYILNIDGCIHDGWLHLKYDKDLLNEDYLYYILSSENLSKQFKNLATGGVVNNLNKELVSSAVIPLPPLDIQDQVKDFDRLEKLIDGCKQVVDNYKPSFDIDPSWEMVELENVANFKRGPFGGSLKKEIFVEEGYLVYEQYHAINNDYSKNRYFVTPEKFNEMKAFAVNSGDLIISCSGTMGRISIIPDDFKEGIINQALLKLTAKKDISNLFLKYYLESSYIQSKYFIDQNGAAIQNVGSVKYLKTIPFPNIPISIQKGIVQKIEEERKVIEGNKKLIEIYTQKIQNRINKVWGE